MVQFWVGVVIHIDWIGLWRHWLEYVGMVVCNCYCNLSHPHFLLCGCGDNAVTLLSPSIPHPPFPSILSLPRPISLFLLQVYARSTNSEATHPSFGPIKQLLSQVSFMIPDNVQIFGENMFGVHSLEYDRLDSYFYIFGVLEDSVKWLSWDSVTELADMIGIPTVPLITRKQVILAPPTLLVYICTVTGKRRDQTIMNLLCLYSLHQLMSWSHWLSHVWRPLHV